MMILTIDIGNSNIVFGCVKDENILFVSRIVTNTTFSYEKYSDTIKSILEKNNIDIKEIVGSIITSVVPLLTATLEHAVKTITNTIPLIVSSNIKTDLNFLIPDPTKLGSDRIVDVVSAIHYYAKPLIVFDLGTATTVSVVDENSNFIGGMIMLGVKSSLEALSNKAAQLPTIDLEDNTNIIGKNTVECMTSGIIYGHAAMVDGLISRLKKQVGQKTSVIATGGLARLIIPHCEQDIIYDENLILKGLYLIYMNNCI